MSNPLLQSNTLPPFSQIKAEHAQPMIEQFLSNNRKKIEELLQQDSFNWDNLIAPIEAIDDQLSQAWSPVSHLNSVMNSDELRDAYNACLPLLSEYGTEIGQNQSLQQAYQQIKDSDQFAQLNQAQQTTIEHALRDFRLAGVALTDDKKQRYGEIKKRLSELTSKFGENVMDATQAWTKQVKDEKALSGLPESALGLLKQQAEAKELDGYLITLEFPSFFPILTYCDNRKLREEVYKANVSKASEIGTYDEKEANAFDNSDIMNEILQLRHELAQLLDFKNYAELSVATKMAESPEQVIDFLNDLAAKSVSQAKAEFAELKEFAIKEFHVNELQPWDVSYYAEKFRQQRYAISQEEIRPYLPIDKTLAGMFEVVERLYGIEIKEETEFDSYHDDLRFFSIYKNGSKIAQFYLDLYARAKKRGGAWMDECRVRRTTEQGIQLPVAYLVCNFTPAVGDNPALLTHDELTTLFHEFGHGLHHMLTQIDASAVSGINGVAWDAVELPSQFMENWCYEPEALDFISGHHETSEPLPKELLDKLLAAKNFQSAMMMVRQLEFALFDFLMHYNYDPAADHGSYIQDTLNRVREKVAVVPLIAENRFQHSFSHIFAGGYAAGYYSYKWAEVLSADAFSKFEEDGIFNQSTGQKFLTEILEKGGSDEAGVLFKNFRGRDPEVDALLRHSGIKA